MVTGDYSVYSRKGGVDLYYHILVMWASDWGWIEQTLNSRRSPPETEVFSFSLSAIDALLWDYSFDLYIFPNT